MGTGSFPGVKRPGRGADHPPPPSAEVKKEYSYTFTYPLGQFRPVMSLLYFTFYIILKFKIKNICISGGIRYTILRRNVVMCSLHVHTFEFVQYLLSNT
jgi:hypothetical protein